MASRRIGNYRVLDYIGSGGFGSVFKAEEAGVPGRIVAIKELHRKHTRDSVIKQRFFQEAVAMARLDHPNLPRLFTFGEDNGSYYLVMEFISGKVLSEAIAEQGAIGPDRAVTILSQMLDAVSYAHRNGIVHRDLKPDNIILVEDSDGLTVKVLDFGIARMIGGGNLTLTGEGFGTPAYMAPERITASEKIDHRIDIYSAGIILFEMLSGRVPFFSSATDPSVYWSEMRRFHESEPLPPLASLGVSPDLEAVMAKASAKLPEDRYGTAEDMLAALRALESEGAITAGAQASGLLVTTQPGGAEVLVDDVLRGASDPGSGRILIDNLAPGPHAVRVSKAGYNEYRINVLLESGRRADLQVALAARATVHMPGPARTGLADFETEKIALDEELTRVLVEGVPPGSTVFLGSNEVARAGEDGLATIVLAPGVHEIEVKTPSGVTRKNVITVTNEDGGALKTVRMGPEAGAPADTIPLAPVENSAGSNRFLATGAAALLLLALAVAAYFVLRGPAQVNSATAPPEEAKRAEQGAQAAAPATADASTEGGIHAAALEEPHKTDLEKKMTEAEKKKAALEAEAARREVERLAKAAATADKPAPQAEACASVVVLGAPGQRVHNRRVALIVDPGAPNQSMMGGVTDGEGRWQQCGLTPGRKVVVRLFGPGRGVIATQMAIIQPGNNQLALRLERMGEPPTLSPDRPEELTARPNNFRPGRAANQFKRRRRP